MKKNTILLVVFLLLAGIIYFVYNIQSKNIKPEPKQEAPVTNTSEKFVNETQGYSVNLTKNYKTSKIVGHENSLIHISGNPDNGITWITTEPANGRTVDEVANAEIADQKVAYKEINIKRSEVTIDGEQGIVLEPLTGQNLIRLLIVVHNDTLYRMSFTPDDPQLAEPYEQMDDLYKTVVGTFRFIE